MTTEPAVFTGRRLRVGCGAAGVDLEAAKLGGVVVNRSGLDPI